MIDELRQSVQARGLLREWVSRTLRARYQQSVMGWLWAVLQPAAQAAILAVVFTKIVPVETGGTPYLLFSYAATVPWTFLASSLSDMTTSVADNMSLVTKIYFPREIIPLGLMLARLLDMVVAFGVYFVLAAYLGVPVVSTALLFLPCVVATQVLMVTGTGLACAAGNVFVRDVRTVLILVTQLWFYASPVIYPVDAVPEAVRPFYALNPMVGILEGYRAVLLRGQLPGAWFAATIAGAVICFFVGFTVFKKLEARFADIV